MNIKKCKCGADIAFVEMTSGKKMPIDSKPEQMVWIPETPAEDFTIANAEKPIGKMVKVYRPHWGTCPLAKKFKKKGD